MIWTLCINFRKKQKKIRPILSVVRNVFWTYSVGKIQLVLFSQNYLYPKPHHVPHAHLKRLAQKVFAELLLGQFEITF